MATLFASGALWNTASNWGTTSGASDGTVPTTSDDVKFDSNSISMAIDVAAVCLTLDSTGYTATLTQNNTFTLTVSGNFTWAAGTFVGGDSNIDINNGNFLQSGGTFTNSSGDMNIERNFDVSGGTFNNSNKITFDGADGPDDTTVTFSGTVPGTVGINKTNLTNFFKVASGTTIDLGASPSTAIQSTFTNDGTILISSGTWTHTGPTSAGGVIQNNGTITHSGTGWVMVHSGITNAVGATITYSGTTISLDRDFDQTGTFDTTGMTITFTGTNNSDNSTITFAGTLAAIIVFNKTNTTSNITIATGTTIGLGAGPTSNAGNLMTNNGTINIPSGTWTYVAISSGSAFVNNGTVTHSGNGWVISNCGITNNTGATITYSGTTISMDDDFTDDGTFDTTGITITFVGVEAGDDTSFFESSQVFEGNIIINKTNVTSTFTLGSNVTIQGDFTRTDGVFDNPSSAFTLTLEGDFSMSTTDNFGGANLTLKFSGSGNQNITQNAGTIVGPVVIDKSGNTATLLTAISTGSTFDITNGIFDVDGNNLTSTGAFAVASGGTLRLRGDETFTTSSTTLNASSTVIYHTGATTAVIDNLSLSFSNITLGASKTHNFTASSTFTISGTFASDGSAATRSLLRSTVAATTWLLNLSGGSTLADKVDVKDSDASTGIQVSAIGSVDSGNNTNWLFTTMDESLGERDVVTGAWRQPGWIALGRM